MNDKANALRLWTRAIKVASQVTMSASAAHLVRAAASRPWEIQLVKTSLPELPLEPDRLQRVSAFMLARRIRGGGPANKHARRKALIKPVPGDRNLWAATTLGE